jgi:RHS repeat-associated protein
MGGGGAGGGGRGGSGSSGDAGAGAGGSGTGTGADDDSRTAPAAECTGEGHPVDVATGRMFSVQRDFKVRGIFPLQWDRGYSSFARRQDGPLGRGWTHSYAWSIEERRTELVLRDETLVKQRFPLLGIGDSKRGAYGRTLTRVGAGFVLRTADGMLREFEPVPARSGWWRQTSHCDRSGNAIRLHYDAQHLTELSDTVGRRYRVVYGHHGRMRAIEGLEAGSHEEWVTFVRYEYSDDGHLVGAIDAAGFARRYSYDTAHHLVRETNRNGLTYHFCYDDSGRCIETWGAYDSGSDPAIAPARPKRLHTWAGRTPVKGIFHRAFHYIDVGLTEVCDTRGGFRTYESDGLGKVTKQVVGRAVTTKELDPLGQLLAVVDAEENLWRYRRDSEGRLIERLDPLGRSTRFEYADGADQPSAVSAPNGGHWAFRYDGRGNLLGVIDPNGATTEYRVDERGQRIGVRGPSGTWTGVVRDSLGMPIKLESEAGRWALSYDYWGRPTTIVRPDGLSSRLSYDARGLVTEFLDERGRSTRFEYDGEENVVAVHRPDGHTNRASYGGANWITSVETPDGRNVRLLYDEEGDIVEARNAAGETCFFEHDLAGRVKEVRAFDGRRIRFEYTPLGRKRVRIDADRTRTIYAYDAVGNLVSQQYAGGATDTYAYDALDFVIAAMNADARVTYERDLCGRVVRERIDVGAESFEVFSTHDPEGRLTLRRAGSHTLELERDSRGDVVRRSLDGSHVHLIERDAMRRTKATRFDSGVATVWDYDPSGLITGVRVERPRAGYEIEEGLTRAEGSTNVVARTYGYSLSDELTELIDADDGAVTFEYDPVGRLLSLTTAKSRQAFDYDQAGNVRSHGEVLLKDGGDRVVQKGDLQLVWNEVGQLVRKQSLSDPARLTRYTWSAAGMLASVDNGPGSGVTRFAYDPFGRRVLKWTSGGPRVRFGWCMNSLASEIRSQGDIVEERSYVFDEDEVRPVAQFDSSGWRDVVTTPIGTPTELVDASGRITWRARLSAFGEVEDESTSRGSPCDLRFPGQYHDRETGLHYNRFRYYDAELGRYISADPIGLEGGFNEYAYATNPIGWIDPLGLANGAALAANMPGARPPGHQAHHLVPEELYGPPPHAALSSLDPHEGRNGIYLPTYHDDVVPGGASTIHRGSHPRFTEHASAELDRVEREAQREHQRTGRPICECRREGVSRLQDSLRSNLHSGAGSVRSDGGSGLNNADTSRSRPASRPRV